ncbi:hypothetical protein GJQ63_26305, partial [Escherichia coli]|uniref:thioredoxin family protein n=1 Tax=Escherichia coli TaxID=562 RepID=UPI001696F1A3
LPDPSEPFRARIHRKQNSLARKMMKEVCSLAELEKVLNMPSNRNKLIVVCYSSPDCRLCSITNPFIATCCEDYPDVLFLKVDTVKSPEFIGSFGITGLPAFQYFKDCQKLHEYAGASNDYFLKKLCEFHGDS